MWMEKQAECFGSTCFSVESGRSVEAAVPQQQVWRIKASLRDQGGLEMIVRLVSNSDRRDDVF